MICSHHDLHEYLRADAVARWGHIPSFLEKLKLGKMWVFQKTLRKQEYNLNVRKGILREALRLYYIYKMRCLTYSLGWDIPPNVFGPGLCIVHIGPVVVNEKTKVGKNCRIQCMVNIGAHHDKAPILGDNIYIGPGAKLFGEIVLSDSISIGANAVVNKSCLKEGAVLVGVPAKAVK